MELKKIAVLILLAFIFGCTDQNDLSQIQEYQGPSYELTDVQTLYSEGADENTAFVSFKLVAPRQQVFEDNNLEFPEGIYIENFKPDGSIAFTLKANKGYYDDEEKTYRAEGNVVLRDLVQDQQLNTEELYWIPGPGDEAIYTDKFVTVKTPDNIIYGEGLRASQNFETYKILKPTGDIATSGLTR